MADTGGRPSKYKPEYCEQVIKFMSNGASLVEFAAHINVSKDTVYEWAKIHPMFSDSLGEARSKCQAAMEKMGRLAMVDKLYELNENGEKVKVPVDFRYYQFFMRARFDDFRDKHSLELHGKDGGAIKVDNISDSELQASIDKLTSILRKDDER